MGGRIAEKFNIRLVKRDLFIYIEDLRYVNSDECTVNFPWK